MLHFARTILFIHLLLIFTGLTGCDDSGGGDSSAYPDTQTDSETDTATDAEWDTTPVAFTAAHLAEVTPIRQWSTGEISQSLSLLKLQVPESDGFAAKVKSAVSVYRLTYRTLYLGEPVLASALLAIPQTATPLPVLAFQNGTNTLYEDAPTQSAEGPVMRVMAASAALGYVLMVADYLGFGVSTQLVHPYLCREITAATLADMLRAAVELDATDTLSFGLNGDLFLAGYSQGGHATMALHQYLETDADFPLSLVGTAAGAGPYDLTALNQYMLTQPTYSQPYFGAYTMLAFQSVGFVGNDLSLYFNQPYAELIPGLFNGTLDGDQINGALTTDMTMLYTIAVQTDNSADAAVQQLQYAFGENSISPFASSTPVRLSHGSADTYIPQTVSDDFYQGMIAAGTAPEQVTYVEIPNQDHEGAAPFAIVDAIRWFNQLNGY